MTRGGLFKGAKKKPLWGTCIGIYAGQYFDSEAGLHYNYHRYYDPQLGRYLRADPIGIEGVNYNDPSLFIDDRNNIDDYVFAINLYSYVELNPIGLIDPIGFGSKGERGATGGSSGQNTRNKYKHCKDHPTDPTKIICKHHQTGKWITKPKPADWPGNGSFECGEKCKHVIVGIGIGLGEVILWICTGGPLSPVFN